MALVTEILLVSGVALDLVGAGVLSHAHNAESIVELREDIGEAVGEPDALSHPRSAVGRETDRLSALDPGAGSAGLILRAEGLAMMGLIAGGVVVAGLVPFHRRNICRCTRRQKGDAV